MKQEDMPTSIQTAQVDMAALIKLQEDYDLALAENARLKKALDKYSEDEIAIEAATLRLLMAELEAEVKQLRLDGERYRWLRKNGGFFAPELRRHLVYKDGAWDYDAAIDAAREGK